MPYIFSPSIILLSFVFSTAIGVVFGYFPARRPAGLDPIERCGASDGGGTCAGTFAPARITAVSYFLREGNRADARQR